jgi:2-dehydropantoate 2-reductase
MSEAPPGPAFATIAIVGAGAVGGFFGAMLARAGMSVTFVARPAQVEAIARDGLRLAMGGRTETLRNVAATTELAGTLGDADLVLVCVKSTDTEGLAKVMAPHVRPGAVVMSLQNGVENAAVLARHLGARATVVPAVVYVATAMPEPGLVLHHGRGDLVIGALHGTPADAQGAARLEAIVALFARAGVPVRLSVDVRRELWSKLIVNCAYNAISALAQASYARLAALPVVVDLQRRVVEEAVAVAHADGVDLELGAAMAAMEGIARAMPGQLSSTAQDVARRKPSEIDHLNGFVVRRGRTLGIATPANEALYALVKLVEAGHVADAG